MAALALDTTFPHARADDHEDVRCALTVAKASWTRGSVADAAKWLRRAAKAAADSDDLFRALELSKTAAALDDGELTSDRHAAHDDVPRAGSSASAAPAGAQDSRPPMRRSGFAPKRPTRSARRATPDRPEDPPARRRSAPVPLTAAAPRPAPMNPSRQAPRLPRRSPAGATRPDASDHRPAPTASSRERASTLRSAEPPAPPTSGMGLRRPERGRSRPPTKSVDPFIPPPPPPPCFELPALLDDDEDMPTVIRPRPTAIAEMPAPAPSQPIALDKPAPTPEPSSPSLPGLLESHDEETIRDRGRLHPPVREVQPPPIPLSAARVAVVPKREGGKPDIFFLPFGASPPAGAVTAMLVTTNAQDAARLAELMTAATS